MEPIAPTYSWKQARADNERLLPKSRVYRERKEKIWDTITHFAIIAAEFLIIAAVVVTVLGLWLAQ